LRDAAGDYPQEAARWRRLTYLDENARIPSDALFAANRQREQNLSYRNRTLSREAAAIVPSSWASRGPNNVGLYRGTGEGFFNTDAIKGAGVLKTTDSGASWSRIASTAGWDMVNRIAIAPGNSNLHLAGVQPGGIMRSTNGGVNWTNARR